MSDTLFEYSKRVLPPELQHQLREKIKELEDGNFAAILTHRVVRCMTGATDVPGQNISAKSGWPPHVYRVLKSLQSGTTPRETGVPDYWSADACLYLCLLVAQAALQSFLQANITGPPLTFSPSSLLLSKQSLEDGCESAAEQQRRLRASLSLDGEAAYQLTPHIELLCLAQAIVHSEAMQDWLRRSTQMSKLFAWVKLRVDFVHQKVLSEVSPTLQASIQNDLATVYNALEDRPDFSNLMPAFLLEKATIETHFGLDKKAQDTLSDASRKRKFDYALTGVLGKRTRYQEKDTSQLVVLARSHDTLSEANGGGMRKPNRLPQLDGTAPSQPQNLDLNDDTVLERIAFTPKDAARSVTADADLPASLASLDPSNQPVLHPLDSAILLAVASSISNTRPDEGLTREETLPFAQRVLEGGSSNWQVYTQALLVRSRIEGYRSRTTERGLLQLQALVDQVIAETTGTVDADYIPDIDSRGATPTIQIDGAPAEPQKPQSSTFLPRPNAADSAPVTERLKYIYVLSTPFRWSLEAELAVRWTSLGGLRSALEIYERLEMWPEAALCWAATEREDKAVLIIRRLLYDPKDSTDEDFQGLMKDPSPPDAPRLFCILADMSMDPVQKINHYTTAWTVSKQRYARAQRSLGRLYYSERDFKSAAAAYNRSLGVNALHGQAWFALGCALLELSEWDKATEAFARVVKLDDTDAEGWSNLAAALLRGYEANGQSNGSTVPITSKNEDADSTKEQNTNPQQPLLTALTALKRAAALKHDSALIWGNVITVALTISPPAYLDALVAQRRVIELRGAIEGEKCIDAAVIEACAGEVLSLPSHTNSESANGEREENPALQRGIPRMFLALLDELVVPLITSSARLWRLVARVRLWQGQVRNALDATERAWRAAMQAPGSAKVGVGANGSTRDALSVPTPSPNGTPNGSGQAAFEDGGEKHWREVVQATLELCDGYESLGPRKDGEGKEVLPDWKFKARSAVRGVMGRGKELWGESEEMEVLKERLGELRG